MASQEVHVYCPSCDETVRATRITQKNGQGRIVLNVTRCPRGHDVP